MKEYTRLIFLFTLMIAHSLLAESIPYRNVMYYGESSIYSGQKNFYPSNIDANLITHLIFAFLDFNSNGDLVLNDEYADFQTVALPELEGINFSAPYAGIFGAMSILKVKNSHLKLGVSVGGATRTGDFGEISRDKLKRQNFAANIAKFIVYVGFDFIDINLDTPNSEKVKEFPRNLDESENLVLLLKEIRNELDVLQKDGRRYELIVTTPGSPERLSKIKYDEVLKYVNFTNLITYDLNIASYSYTLHISPLYTNEDYPIDGILDSHYSVDDSIKYLENTYQNTIDMTKVVIGVAPYTRAWSGVKDAGFHKDNPGLYDYAIPNSVRSVDGTTSGIYGFHDLPSLIKQFDLIEFFDQKAKAAYYYSPTTGYFFSCDNKESVAAKGKYVKDKGLGGLFMWMASYDAENTFTKAMFSSLYEKGYTFPKRELIYRLISISSGIKATETGYDFTIQNNYFTTETNPALKYAELYQNSIVNMIVTIKTKSGTEFIPDNKSGTIVNENGVAIIDPSSNPDARIIQPNYGRYTFSVKINGTSNVDDIRSVFVSQRILPSMSEFKKRIVYDNRD